MNKKPWLDLISEETVLELHHEGIIRYHGKDGLREPDGCVDRSLAAAWNAELYSDSPDAQNGLCFACCLLFYLAKNNCFMDGNKRVGWAACMEVLRGFGLTVKATDDEVEQFCNGILTGSENVRDAIGVTFWIAPRLISL